jgi:hypothetical protein
MNTEYNEQLGIYTLASLFRSLNIYFFYYK